jgi:hypothetical protein
MPSVDGILAGLSETANTWRSLAVTWHLLLSALLVAFVAGCRLSTRLIALVAIASVLTVSALSWVSDNPFNGIVFAALATALIAAATRRPAAAIEFDSPRRAVPGAALVVFGWTYPHFLTAEAWTEYAYAAPFGLIPCPTLAVVIGLTLLVRNIGTSAWKVPLIMAGFLYGIVGVFALEVVLDVALLAGALVLAVVAAYDSGW